MATFDIHSDGINAVLGKLMQYRTRLWQHIKLWLMISHGNAEVESGFSTNEQIQTTTLRKLHFSHNVLSANIFKAKEVS